MRNIQIPFLVLVGSIIVVLALKVNSGSLGNSTLKAPQNYPNNSTISPTETPTLQPTTKPTVLPTKTPVVVKITTQPSQQPNGNLPILNGGNIFGKINAYRITNGRPSWSVSDELCRLAESRAEYLIQPTYEDFMKNTYPSFKNHPGFQDMASALNYSGIGLSENLAMGAKSDEGVIQIWKNSPPHNALMLATDHNGTVYTKACVATRVKYYGSISVLLAGDK